MRKEISVFIASIAIISLAGAVQANLLENGDFENTDDTPGLLYGKTLESFDGAGDWDVYESLPENSWVTAAGPGIEVQYDGTAAPAHSGNLYVELDSHGYTDYSGDNASNSAMEQGFSVNTEMEYYLSLWYKPRTDTVNDNGISIYLNDQDKKSIFENTGILNGQESTTPNWTEYHFNLGTLSIGEYTLGFQAVGEENTLGGFLDDIAVNPVPEPATMLLFGTGLAALAGLRTRRKK